MASLIFSTLTCCKHCLLPYRRTTLLLPGTQTHTYQPDHNYRQSLPTAIKPKFNFTCSVTHPLLPLIFCQTCRAFSVHGPELQSGYKTSLPVLIIALTHI